MEMRRREAIENLDYEWFIKNEKDETRKNKLIEMYFESQKELSDKIKDIKKYLEKECRDWIRKVYSMPDGPHKEKLMLILHEGVEKEVIKRYL
jgi:hypothetical protein